MRVVYWPMLSACCLVMGLGLAACQSSPDPIGNAPAALPETRQFQLSGERLMETAVPLGMLHVDPARASASIELLPDRGVTTNDQLAFLSVDSFFKPQHLKVTGVASGENTLDLTLTIAHPFPAPAFFKPVSATNRADLGFAGRLVILADTAEAERPRQSFFGDTVRANTMLVADADGYTQPRGLLATETWANTFPYVLVIDEARDNRLDGITNGGTPTGNYYPTTGGWQRGNLGPARTSWTGYGFLHQGQRAAITLRLRTAALGDAPFTLPLALLAKYVQPTGGPVPAQNRLPQPTVNVDQFAYRLPYGALDAERVTSTSAIRLREEDPASAATVEIAVRDWDARAIEASLDELWRDTDVAHIPQHTRGAPAAWIDAPTIDPSGPIGLSEFQPGQRSGLPGNEIVYRGTLRHTAGRADGTWWGMVQVIDPESADPARFGRPYEFDLAPGLVPITDPQLRVDPVTYQALPIIILPVSAPAACPDCHLSTGRYNPAAPFTVNLSSFTDDSPLIKLRFRYSGPLTRESGELVLTPTAIAAESTLNPWHDSRLSAPLPSPGAAGVYKFFISADDGDTEREFGPFPFELVPIGGCPFGDFTATTVHQPLGWQRRLDLATLVPGWASEPITPSILAAVGLRKSPGWILTQGPNNQLWGVSPLTGEVKPATVPEYPGPGWARRALLLEVDSRQRAFWVASNIDQSVEPDPSLESIYDQAGSIIHVIDLRLAPVAGDLMAIDVGAPVVAMCIDESDHVWAVDGNNTLRHFIPISGGYTEDIGSGILLSGTTAGGIFGACVYDIDVDFHNGAFYLPVRAFNDTLSLWRIECDGVLTAPGGNPNPLADITGGPVRDAAIVIDNYGANSQVLAGQQDAQILVAVENGAGWLGIVTSELARTSQRASFRGASRLAMLYEDNLAYSLDDQAGAFGWNQFEQWRMPTGWK